MLSLGSKSDVIVKRVMKVQEQTVQTDGTGRNPDLNLYSSEKTEANTLWEKLLADKWKVIRYAMGISQSTIKHHRLLILVDLQGMYLAFHKWLSQQQVPIDDGIIIGKFALLQIERTALEVANRIVKFQQQPALNLKSLFDSIDVSYVDGKAYTNNSPLVLKGGTYIDVSMSFEMFYAPVPIERIKGDLFREVRKSGSIEAKNQLRKIQSGIVTRKDVFERDYKVYDDFVSYLKESTHHSRSQEGFFGLHVDKNGLNYFDEKEVDIRIAIRTMDALYRNEADSICIISSDQDFMPLHSRADDFDVTSFQADLAKFMEDDKVGAQLKKLGDRFIQGGIEPHLRISVNPISDSGVIRSPANRSFS